MLILALILSLPISPVKADHVAIIELNHVHNDDAEPRFDQLIFWEFRRSVPLDGDGPTWSYHVIAWRIVEAEDYRLRKEQSRWVLTLWDRETDESRQLRIIRAVSFRETWTNHDREIEQRTRLHQDYRRGLSP